MAIGSVLVHYSTEEVPVASLESVEDQPTFTKEPRLGQRQLVRSAATRWGAEAMNW